MSATTTVAVVSFTDPRRTEFEGQREQYLRERHQALTQALTDAGLAVFDPMAQAKDPADPAFGLRTNAEVMAAAALVKGARADCLVFGCWHWTEPMLPMALVRETDLPVLLFTEDDPAWAGSVCISAVGASLWEVGLNHHAASHARSLGDYRKVIRWAHGVGAIMRLRRQSLLLWGGSYCLRMEHLQDDIPMLKARFVGDIINEGEYALIKRAEQILASQPARVADFITWLENGGAKIVYDSRMLTEQSLRRQAALYLAARDRLHQLAGEEIAGVSVHCQPELSVDYGVTACLLPAFLPFGQDSQGRQPVVPTVCEGDIKGLVTCCLLHGISAEAPPLFGDLKYLGNDYLIISNCGASSVWYAANSDQPAQVLPRLTLAGQCQGESGGAVGYQGQPGPVTLARLVRIKGQYLMQLGAGRSLEITSHVTRNILWGKMWPHVAISLDVPRSLLVEAVASNHYSAIPGDYTAEVEYACREAAIPVLRLDSEEALAAFRP